ncbi:hypothetical protein ACTNDN_00770 [Niallia sp. HCP3S3_B10]
MERAPKIFGNSHRINHQWGRKKFPLMEILLYLRFLRKNGNIPIFEL